MNTRADGTVYERDGAARTADELVTRSSVNTDTDKRGTPAGIRPDSVEKPRNGGK